MPEAAGVITVCSYYNSAFYYPRTMAVSCGRRMLISSGDSLRTLSSILSGEGFDEREQRESPFVFSPWSTPTATDFPKKSEKSEISEISLCCIARCALRVRPVFLDLPYIRCVSHGLRLWQSEFICFPLLSMTIATDCPRKKSAKSEISEISLFALPDALCERDLVFLDLQ
jgi:hypothetical protein